METTRNEATSIRVICACAWILLAPLAAVAGPWTGANPGAGGAFTSIGAGPTGIILCGSDLGGAYRSLDRGQSWDAIGPAHGMDVTHVSAVGFDPQDANVAYLGTAKGAFRSDDGGSTFQKVIPSTYIAAIAAAPSNASVVYAAYHTVYESTQGGLFRSTDRGLTWSDVAADFPDSLRITKLVVHPTDPSVLFLVSGSDLSLSHVLPSLWRSTDGGSTWSRLAQSLGNVWDFALDPSDPQTQYVTVYTGTPHVSWSGSVYKSIDGGVTWTLAGDHTGAVLVKRDQPQTVWVIDPGRDEGHPEQGVWESTDGGATWSKKSDMSSWNSGWQAANWAYGGNAYGMGKVLGQDLSNPEVIFWSHRQFVFASFDGGARFENLFTRAVSSGSWITRGIENVAVTGVAISEADPNQMYTGYFDLGLWRSIDGGASWQTSNHPSYTGEWEGHGGCSVSIVPDPARPSVVFAIMGGVADAATVVKSTSAGEQSSWTGANGGLPSGLVLGLSMDRSSPSSQRTLFVTSDGDVYQSTDDGSTWSLAFDCNTCRVTAVDRSNGALVYAGGEGGLWRSTAGGAPGSWMAVGLPSFVGAASGELKAVEWTGIHAITPDPQISGRVYVAVHGSGRGIFRSNDQGGGWIQLRGGDYFRGVAVNPSNPNEIFATSSRAYKSGGNTSGSDGVLRSGDGGRTWLSLNDGLPWPFAGPIAIDPGNPSRIIVGSPGTGFWIRNLDPIPPGSPPATTINVPGDYPTLQSAVAAAASGDTILFAPGTYSGGAWVQGKSIVVASRFLTTGDTAYIAQTILRGFVSGVCGGASGCTGDAVLEFGPFAGGSSVIGLTVTEGKDGVRSASGSDVNIAYCRILGNEDGVDYTNSGGTISNSLFANNTDDGIDLNRAVSARILDNTVRDNEGDGLEVRLHEYSGSVLQVDVIGNRFIRNSSDAIRLIDSPDSSHRVIRIESNLFTGSGKASVGCLANQAAEEDFSGAPLPERVFFINNTCIGEHHGYVGGANVIALNNIFVGTQVSALRRVAGNSIASHNLFWNNGIDYEESSVDTAYTLHADPLLDANHTLTLGSPAIDAGTSFFQWMGETVWDRPPASYLGPAPDLGSFEFDINAPAPPNSGPQVDAGTPQTIRLPAEAVLDGTAGDDGLPIPPRTLTTSWSVESGPDPVAFLDASAVDTRATFTVAGTYVLRLTASDGELSATDSVSIVVLTAPPLDAVTVERRIAAGADDAEETASGSLSVTGSDLELVFDGSNQHVGLRFTGLAIPAGATITGAHVQFEADEAQSEATNLLIQGQAADTAGAFTSALKISPRPRTAASVSWTPAPWAVVSEAGVNQRTPDISAVLQEIVGRPGWTSGNAVALIITGSGHRTARAYEAKPAGAALLHVQAVIGGAPTANTLPQAARAPRHGFALPGARPNPTRSSLILELSLADGPATLEVLDVAGRCIARRDVGKLGPGSHRLEMRKNLPAGVYFVRLTQDGHVAVKKAVVLK